MAGINVDTHRRVGACPAAGALPQRRYPLAPAGRLPGLRSSPRRNSL